MRQRRSIFRLCALSLFVFLARPLHAVPLGSAITYQGHLNDGGTPANGTYDLRFALWDAQTNGSPVGPALTNSATSVSNGLFVAVLDFGAGVFDGNARWLEIAVRTNGGSEFTALTPRQRIMPYPAALYAPNAGTASSVSAANITGTLPNSVFPPGLTNQWRMDATDAAVTVVANSNLPAAHLTGALPAIDGSALTGITSGQTNAVYATDSTMRVVRNGPTQGVAVNTDVIATREYVEFDALATLFTDLAWLTSKGSTVDVNFLNSYDPTYSWLGGTELYWINNGTVSRIRQAGTISNVELIIGATNNCTGFWLDLWRQSLTTGLWTRFYSENIVSKLRANATNTVTPASNVVCQVGDFVGGHWTASSTMPSDFTPAYSVASNASYDTTSDPGTTDVAWTTKTPRTGIIPIRVRMESPVLLVCGDSTVAGYPANPSYMSWSTATNNPGTFPQYLAQIMGLNYQNLGVSSYRLSQVYGMFTNVGLASKGRTAFVAAGLNDLAYATNDFGGDAYTFVNAQSNYFLWATNFLTSARDNGVAVIWCKIWPWHSGAVSYPAFMTNRDIWNSNLVLTCAAFSNVVAVVDVEDYIGTNWPAGPPGNKWDMKAEYGCGDGVHWNTLGYSNMAWGVYSEIKAAIQATGRLPANRLPADAAFGSVSATSFTGNGAGLTSLNISGTVQSNLSVAGWEIFLNRNVGPTAQALGANNGGLWVSNAALYFTFTTDGTNATTVKVAGPSQP